MKLQLFRILALVTLLSTLAVVSVNAQSAGDVRATIPFSFTVGGQTLPAGEYTFKSGSVTNHGSMKIDGVRTRSHARALTNAVRTLSTQTETRLVFRKYGEQYFLTQIWSEGENQGRQVPESKRERDLRRELASNPNANATAQNGSDAETIVLSVN
jgi:hypothetical protein